MAQSSRLFCALLLGGLVACGGKSFDGDRDPNGGGSDQGGSSQGGSSAGSSKGGTTSKAGSGQGGSAACTGFQDDVASSYVQVSILNKTSAPIYLGQEAVTCDLSPLFQVGDASGAWLQPPDVCTGSCQMLIESGPVGCPGICALPSAVALQPGETLYTTWDGLFQVERQVPRACVPTDFGVASCQQTRAIRPDAFTFSAVAGRSIDCGVANGGACVPCTPGATGGCRTQGALIGGQLLNAVTHVQLDYSYGVYGNPAPLPLPPGGDSNAIALRPVELVFTE